jgi:hypothetical protein
MIFTYSINSIKKSGPSQVVNSQKSKHVESCKILMSILCLIRYQEVNEYNITTMTATMRPSFLKLFLANCQWKRISYFEVKYRLLSHLSPFLPLNVVSLSRPLPRNSSFVLCHAWQKFNTK